MANPQTKPEARKTERQKKGAGLLARLLGRGAGSVNGNPTDMHFFGCRQPPSETALKKMVA